MKKSLVKGLVLGVIFVFTIIMCSNMMNKDLTQNTTDLKEPTLPMMYMQISDTLINPMYGYENEMEAAYVRDCVTPLSTKRELVTAIKPFDNEIEGVTYEVMHADGSKVLEKGKLSNLKPDGEYQKIAFALETPLLMNQEYMLKFSITCKGKEPLHYYTRLVQRAGLNTGQYINFVNNFYEKSLNKEAAQELTTYIGPDENVPVTNFNQINVHSNFDQITWGSLKPTLFRRGIPTINEINETTCSISIDYELTAEDSEKNIEHYDVTEFYRMRYSQARIMLIDFERNAQEIFNGKLPVLTTQGINIGIANKNIQYVSNQSADIIAFVQAGDLWSYNRSANKAARIFSFRENETADERLDDRYHDIKIVRVEETGDIDFVLYGYSSRGENEGKMGIGVYHYSVGRNAVEEMVFIETNRGYDFIAEDVNQLSYVSQDNHLYILLDENIYDVDLNAKSQSVMLDNVSRENFAASKSQKSIAWLTPPSEEAPSTITTKNLETGETHEAKPEGDEQLRILGFINEDVIYGSAKPADIITDAAGNTIFGMGIIKIQNDKGEILKEYYEEGKWFTSAEIKEGLVEVKRAVWNGSAYVATSSENIINNQQENLEAVNIRLSSNDRKGTQVALDFSKSAQNKSMLVLEAKHEVPTEDRILEINATKDDEQLYYIYAGGHLESVQSRANEAINQAEEKLGVVLNSQQQYIWERGNRDEKARIEPSHVPEAVLAGTLDEKTLQENLGDEYTVLNLTGNTLDSVLYQVSQQRAVVALMASGEHVVIVGYDRFNTILYNIETKETYYCGINDSTDVVFGPAGNVFVGYIKNIPTEE